VATESAHVPNDSGEEDDWDDLSPSPSPVGETARLHGGRGAGASSRSRVTRSAAAQAWFACKPVLLLLAGFAAGALAGPPGYCPPRHPTHFESSSPELSGIL